MKQITKVSRLVLPVLLLVGMLFTNATQVLAVSGTVTGINVGAQSGVLTSGTAGSATYSVSFTRNGTGAVSISGLSVTSGLPAGATAGWSATSSTGVGNATPASVVLTINTTVGTPAGSFNFTVSSTSPVLSNTTGTLTIGVAKTTPTISVTNSPVTYNGAQQSAIINASTAGLVNDIKYDGSSTMPTNAGTYAVTADFTPTDTVNYNSLADASAGNFVINQASSSTTVTCPVSVIYTGSAQTPCTVLVTPVGDASLTPAPTYTSNTNVGTANASYTYAGDLNHPGSTDNKNFEITQASSVTDVTCPVSVPYTGSAQTPCTVSVTGAGELSLSPAPSYTNNTNAGTANASYTYAGDDNHSGSSDSQDFSIDKVNATITVTPYSVTYDGNPHTATGSVLGILSEILAGLDLSLTTHTDAGIYNGDVWNFTDVTGNYNDDSGTVDDLISPPEMDDLTVEKTVDNDNPDVGETITYTIVVTNNGEGAAHHVLVNDLLPEGLTFVSYTATEGTYDEETGVWTLGSHPLTPNGPNSYETLTITVEVGEGDVITNTATASSDRDDSNTEDNSDSVDVTVNNPEPVNGSVHIFKFIDGEQATVETADGDSFPMITPTYGNAPFTLDSDGWTEGDLPYEASTSEISAGGSYTAYENTETSLVGTSCEDGKPYALVGYSSGSTPEEAAENELSESAPTFTIDGDSYLIVWNEKCEIPEPTTLKVHIVKYLDNGKGISPVSNEAEISSFPMTSSWSAENIGAGSGSYELGNYFGGSEYKYGADTSAMQAPADYSTEEVTDGDVVVSDIEACSPGKYYLVGYKTGNSLGSAESNEFIEGTPSFTGLTSDKWVIVVNNECPDPEVETPQCSDGVDNADTEDTLVDANDPGCHSDGNVNNGGSYHENDNSESNEAEGQCSDGIDNDGEEDSLIDSLDPACHTDGNTGNPDSWDPNGSETDMGTIIIVKNTEGGDGTFTFESNFSEGNIQISTTEGSGQQTFSSLSAGTYSISEILPEDWELNSASCSDESSISEISLSANETVTCTFLNTKKENNRSSGGSRRGTRGRGQVLGATTDGSSCGIYLDKFIGNGFQNDSESVKKLQQFLNDFMKAGLTVDGKFGPGTRAALNVFQMAYKEDILFPWGIKVPTGLFFLTSQAKLNNLMCPELHLPVPKVN
jgi:uncharacterized repeat protein (TIGR01451 family)